MFGHLECCLTVLVAVCIQTHQPLTGLKGNATADHLVYAGVHTQG